jgi:hypothetical protein
LGGDRRRLIRELGLAHADGVIVNGGWPRPRDEERRQPPVKAVYGAFGMKNGDLIVLGISHGSEVVRA